MKMLTAIIFLLGEKIRGSTFSDVHGIKVSVVDLISFGG